MRARQPSSVSVSVQPDSDPPRTVVWVAGDHDIATQGYLADALDRAVSPGDVDIVIDLSGVTFMDASTIEVIVGAHNRLRADSRSLSIRAPSADARRMFEVCELAFLIDEHRAETPPHAATALGSWVQVPVLDRDPDHAQQRIVEGSQSSEPARATVSRRGEPTGSVKQRPTLP